MKFGHLKWGCVQLDRTSVERTLNSTGIAPFFNKVQRQTNFYRQTDSQTSRDRHTHRHLETDIQTDI